MPEMPRRTPLERQLERIRRITESPILEGLERQREQIKRITESPILEQLERQQEQIRQLTESPILKGIELQEERIKRITENPIFKQLERQQEQIRRLTEGPALAFQADLVQQAIEYAETGSEVGERILSDDEISDEVERFRFRSVQVIVWQLQGLLRALDVMTAAGWAANELSGGELVDTGLLTVMVLIVVTGELLVWMASNPSDGP